ncbi:polysaccharide biosynthesis protein [Caballeronia sordidicola]|uniref:polysaccharide biosynthesis protein n=1 Tax=Caballeronia sordidicola TaxID=196367 RepID=UPI000B77A815
MGRATHNRYGNYRGALCVGINDSGRWQSEDPLLLDQTQSHFTPHIVFHLAACKHVRLAQEQNERLAAHNNVFDSSTWRGGTPQSSRPFHADFHRQSGQPINVMSLSKCLANVASQAL